MASNAEVNMDRVLQRHKVAIEKSVVIRSMFNIIRNFNYRDSLCRVDLAVEVYDRVKRGIMLNEKPHLNEMPMPGWARNIKFAFSFEQRRLNRKSRKSNILTLAIFWDMAYDNLSMVQIFRIPCKKFI